MPELTLPPLDVTEEDLDRACEQWNVASTYVLRTGRKCHRSNAEGNEEIILLASRFCRERQLIAVTTERDHALKELAKQDAGNQEKAVENES